MKLVVLKMGFERKLQLSFLLAMTVVCSFSPASHAAKETRSIEYVLNEPIKQDPNNLLVNKLGGEQFEQNLLKGSVYFLGSSRDKTRRIVAVVSFAENDAAVLNPAMATDRRHCEYTGIPKVTEMKTSFCDSFYGRPVAKSENTRTYEFVDLNDREKKSQIEIQFDKGFASKIKVSGLGNHEAKWVSVK